MYEHEEAELTQLSQLRTEAPPDTVTRLRKRLRVVQLGRDLIERQAFAFWIVLDAFLRLFFGGARQSELPKQQREQQAERRP